MNKTKELVKNIVEGIQDKKGKEIVIADLTNIHDTVCKYFVVCHGTSPSQVEAIAGSVYDYVREHTGEKPAGVDGLHNRQWVVIDYADVMVHVFLPEERDFYDIEHLWEDANLERIADID